MRIFTISILTILCICCKSTAQEIDNSDNKVFFTTDSNKGGSYGYLTIMDVTGNGDFYSFLLASKKDLSKCSYIDLLLNIAFKIPFLEDYVHQIPNNSQHVVIPDDPAVTFAAIPYRNIQSDLFEKGIKFEPIFYGEDQLTDVLGISPSELIKFKNYFITH